MFGLNKLKRDLEQRTQEVEQLKEEVARYKHAFETTAADRDRRLALSLKGNAPEAPVPVSNTHPQDIDSNVASYGALWGSVANIFEAFEGDDGVDQDVFEQILTYGGFSQFTKYDNSVFLNQLVDWQLAMLQRIGLDIDALPAHYREVDSMPAHARHTRGGRQVRAPCE